MKRVRLRKTVRNYWYGGTEQALREDYGIEVPTSATSCTAA
jgi:hypothetical protein